MIITNKLYIALLIALVSVIVINSRVILQFFIKNSFVPESSVWCFKDSMKTNVCRFKNICYDPQHKSMLFFLSNKSIIKGISHYKDLQKIQLSSVHLHNQFYANLSVINSSQYQSSKQILVYEKVFLFSRFKPNNLMHVIHDDLFPLYLSLEFACLGEPKCMEEYYLVLFDHYPKGPYFELYSLFSDILLVVSELNVKNLVCFKEMLTGLVKDGVFFQYGFGKPQGPVRTNLLHQNDIFRFTTFVKSKLKLEEDRGSNFQRVVLINRIKNRKILNVEKIENLVESTYQKLSEKAEIQIINLEPSVNVIDLIKTVSNANVLIGMHGAEIILTLFMKPMSIVFELFPFGIQPDVVSFIKPTSQLDDSQLVYFSWRNLHRNNSVGHPEAHPLFGGISHLDKVTQEKIKTNLEVPAVECCNNPLYLYYMYQDTLVSDEFGEFFYKSLLEYNSKENQKNVESMMQKWFFPYKVSNVACRYHSHGGWLNITWQPTFNINSDNLYYKVYVKDKSGKFEKEFLTEKSTLQVDVPNAVAKFHIWVLIHYNLNDSESPDLYAEC